MVYRPLNYCIPTNFFKSILVKILFPMILILENFILPFHSELVTCKFYFYLLFRVSNSKILFCFIFFFELVTDSKIVLKSFRHGVT